MSTLAVLLRPPLPYHHLRRIHIQALTSSQSSPSPRRYNSEAAEPLSRPSDAILRADGRYSAKAPQELFKWDDADLKEWRRKEAEILQDIEGIWYLTKEILHSDRYECGERLSADDEKLVLEKLLAYHSHREDKIGCGMDYIMVDRHPQFERSRCLFVVRTDGSWIDFSYQKCLRSYIRDKYPSYAERFIKEHFKRSS
uniref:DCL protein n=1 Tax=Kalanchoe fedtschenkoi TaxID=63787 RepID=A0A7N0TQR2_KALFE